MSAAKNSIASAYLNRVVYGDVRETLPRMVADGLRVDCVVTSPPYWGLRDYNADGQLGLEQSLESYLAAQADVFDHVFQLLNEDGTLWVNMGDAWVSQRKGSGGEDASTLEGVEGGKRSHSSKFFVRYAKRTWLRRKNLIGLPWHLAFALQRRGWLLRDAIIWEKTNPLPESVKDRTTKCHEYLFLLARSPRYFYDAAAIAEPRKTAVNKPVGGWANGEGVSHDAVSHNRPLQGTTADEPADTRKYTYKKEQATAAGKRRNARSVWQISTEPYKGPHYASYPSALVSRCVLAGCKPGGVVFDPYMGTGVTAAVAKRLGRGFSGCEINETEYGPLIDARLAEVAEGMQL